MEHKYTQLFSRVLLPMWEDQFSYEQSACMFGSCFAEHAAAFLKNRKFSVMSNPFGILFNPISIENCVQDCLSLRKYTKQDLVQKAGLYHSWNHHGSFNCPDKTQLLEQLRESQEKGFESLKKSSWVLMTLGTAVVYHKRADDRIVANCHRVPSSEFYTRRLSVQECVDSLIRTILAIRAHNPSLRVVLTVSPIRHWSDGAHQNQLSKSVLLLACEELVRWSETHTDAPPIYYFPAYEIMLDELRDYRFYAQDLMHPSDQAVVWIMQSLSQVFIQEESRKLMQEVEALQKGFEHRVLHPNSPENHKFFRQQIQKANDLMLRSPCIDFKEEVLSLQHRLNSDE